MKTTINYSANPELEAQRHRLILTYEAEAQAVTTDAIVKKVLNTVPVQ